LPEAAREGRRYKVDFGIEHSETCRKQLVHEFGVGLVKYPG
jgi:hypothetical protein